MARNYFLLLFHETFFVDFQTLGLRVLTKRTDYPFVKTWHFFAPTMSNQSEVAFHH